MALLWLWHRLEAAAPFQRLAWELPYAKGAAPNRKRKIKDINLGRYFEDRSLAQPFPAGTRWLSVVTPHYHQFFKLLFPNATFEREKGSHI